MGDEFIGIDQPLFAIFEEFKTVRTCKSGERIVGDSGYVLNIVVPSQNILYSGGDV
jgi:hypothetical protein